LQKPLISPFGNPQPLVSCAERLLSFASKLTRWPLRVAPIGDAV